MYGELEVYLLVFLILSLLIQCWRFAGALSILSLDQGWKYAAKEHSLNTGFATVIKWCMLCDSQEVFRLFAAWMLYCRILWTASVLQETVGLPGKWVWEFPRWEVISWYKVGVTGQLHTLATVLLGKSSFYPLGRRLARPRRRSGHGSERRCPALLRNRTWPLEPMA